MSKFIGLYEPPAPPCPSSNVPPSRRIGRGRVKLLGIKDDDKLFSSRDSNAVEQERLFRWPARWYRYLYGKSFVPSVTCGQDGGDEEDKQTYIPTVFDLDLNMLILLSNLTNYHWFYIAVDFDDKTILAHDSMPVVDDHLDINHDSPNILDAVASKTVRELDIVFVRPLYSQLGLSTTGNKVQIMHRLMRIMYVQEAFLFIKEQGERTFPLQKVVDSEWSLSLSVEMPKQDIFKNNCSLFCYTGAHAQSVGNTLSTLTEEVITRMEANGRAIMASIIIGDINVKDEDNDYDSIFEATRSGTEKGSNEDEIEVISTKVNN